MKREVMEVAVPLPEIKEASAYEKMPWIGAHGKRIHHSWAGLRVPVARVVLFASVVDDGSSRGERLPTGEAQ